MLAAVQKIVEASDRRLAPGVFPPVCYCAVLYGSSYLGWLVLCAAPCFVAQRLSRKMVNMGHVPGFSWDRRTAAGLLPRATSARVRKLAKNPTCRLAGFLYLDYDDSSAQPTVRTQWIADLAEARTLPACAAAVQMLLSATTIGRITSAERKKKEQEAKAIRRAVSDMVNQIEREVSAAFWRCNTPFGWC